MGLTFHVYADSYIKTYTVPDQHACNLLVMSFDGLQVT